MSNPKWNYLKHFKEEKYLRQGHNDSEDLANSGLSYDEAERRKAKEIEDSFKGATGFTPKAKEVKEKVKAKILNKPPRGSGYGY